MKLMRIGAPGAETPVVRVDDDDATSTCPTSCTRLRRGVLRRRAGSTGLRPLVAERMAAGAVQRFAGERLGARIARPHQIVCIGLNYADHAARDGREDPRRADHLLQGHDRPLRPERRPRPPRGSVKTDWEVELAVVIGRRARYVSREDAAAHVAGYALHNDYSERQDQLERGGQWSKGKSQDTFAPLGPFLATPDEIGDVHDAADVAHRQRRDAPEEQHETR